MKKLFALVLIAGSFAACNSNADSSSNNGSSDSTKSVTRDGDNVRTDTTGPRVDSGTAK